MFLVSVDTHVTYSFSTTCHMCCCRTCRAGYTCYTCLALPLRPARVAVLRTFLHATHFMCYIPHHKRSSLQRCAHAEPNEKQLYYALTPQPPAAQLAQRSNVCDGNLDLDSRLNAAQGSPVSVRTGGWQAQQHHFVFRHPPAAVKQHDTRIVQPCYVQAQARDNYKGAAGCT